MGIEEFDEFGEIRERTGQTVDFVNDNAARTSSSSPGMAKPTAVSHRSLLTLFQSLLVTPFALMLCKSTNEKATNDLRRMAVWCAPRLTGQVAGCAKH